jgi:hypothetical protein
MSVSTTVNAGQRLVINTAWDTVSDEDFLQARRELAL